MSVIMSPSLAGAWLILVETFEIRSAMLSGADVLLSFLEQLFPQRVDVQYYFKLISQATYRI